MKARMCRERTKLGKPVLLPTGQNKMRELETDLRALVMALRTIAPQHEAAAQRLTEKVDEFMEARNVPFAAALMGMAACTGSLCLCLLEGVVKIE